MATGTIKFVTPQNRTSAVVTDTTTNTEIPIHEDHLHPSMEHGQNFKFDIEENDGKPVAVNLRPHNAEEDEQA